MSIKRTLVALSIIACTVTSAHAEWRQHNRQPPQRQHHYQPHYNNGGHRGGWVAPLIGGAIVGGIIANQYYARPRYQSQLICRDIEMYDSYGPYWTQECWRE